MRRCKKQTILDDGKEEIDKTTTIRISIEFKKDLDKLKIHPRESYEDVIKKLKQKLEGLEG